MLSNRYQPFWKFDRKVNLVEFSRRYGVSPLVIIWSPYHMIHIISFISYGPYDMVHGINNGILQ